MTQPRIIFAGTPKFALAAFRALVDAGQVPVAVLTQPDRPSGRGRRVTASPVKRFAVDHDIPALQPVSLRDEKIVGEIQALHADVMIVAAYGLILPQNILDLPRHGCLNVHASLLPRWRGAAPIPAAILANDATTGISLMRMTAGLDCGPVYLSKELVIAAQETAGELHDRLAALGSELLRAHLADILSGDLTPVEQDEVGATYAGKILKHDAKFDWQRPAIELARKVRAYNPAPGAFFFADKIRVKCWSARADSDVKGVPGTITAYSSDGIVIACGVGGLRLDSLQLPGKRRVNAQEFAAQIDLRAMQLSG